MVSIGGRFTLERNGKTVPFAIREGKARWKADLVAPVLKPRAEDLIVFSARVPPGEWTQVDLVPGAPTFDESLARRDGSLVVSYPTSVR
ncbi:MAG: hypothetical protein U0132_20640 [Gemmatimonadaceae bacterium]